VRLDHLLSKEHPAPFLHGVVPIGHVPGGCPGVACSLVEHWLVSWFHHLAPLVHPHVCGRDAAAGVGWLGTLLGPEGTDVCCLCSLGWTGFSSYGPGHARWCVGWGSWRSGGRDRSYFENCIVDASIICSSQVIKGTRWMPWHQEPMKDVGACDKPRGVGNQTLIRGFPNGETCQA
jgi:hypothetical protein